MKACADCGELKPLADYHRDARRPDGRVRQCKPCRKVYRARWYAANRAGQIAYAREWKRRNRDRIPHYLRKARHGLTRDQYEALVEEQAGRCAICPREGDLRVDHDHETGRIRGLLCDRCNRGLGFFADEPERLRAAAAYVEGGDAQCP